VSKKHKGPYKLEQFENTGLSIMDADKQDLLFAQWREDEYLDSAEDRIKEEPFQKMVATMEFMVQAANEKLEREEDDRIDVGISPINNLAKVPGRATPGSSGLDLYAAETVSLAPGDFKAVSVGFALEIPLGYEAQIRPRSGLAAKFGVTVLNSPGTIDSDYRGEVKVILINHGRDNYLVTAGERIAQMVIASVEGVRILHKDNLNKTERGSGGLGSTGK
jgi:dUTP pyrophosphatase